MRALIFIYIIEVAHDYLCRTHLSSKIGLGVVSRLLSEICWLHIG